MKLVKFPEINSLKKLFKCDYTKLKFDPLRRRYSKMIAAHKKSCITLAAQLLNRRETANDDAVGDRFPANDLLIIAMPDSLPEIRSFLARRNCKYIHETHFTFFSSVEDCLEDLSIAGQKMLIDILAEYVQNTKKEDKAMAAWHAAHVLWDHSPRRLSLPRLIALAKNAPYVAARNLVLGKFWCSPPFGKAPTKKQGEIIARCLRTVAAKDRSRVLRQKARRILKNYHTYK